MRRVILIAGLLASGAFAAPWAHAEELTPEARLDVEHAVMAGRLDDAVTALKSSDHPADLRVLGLLESWWRGPVGLKTHAAKQGAVDGGGPYPLIRALVEDRVRRETQGSEGLPGASPLEAYWKSHQATMTKDQDWVFQNVYRMMVRSYQGDEDPHAQSVLDRAARDGMLTAKLAWLCSLGAFLVLCFFGALIVARRARGLPTEAGDGPPA